MHDHDTDANAQEFARQLEARLDGAAQRRQDQQHQEGAHVPAAPPSPESRVVYDDHSPRKSNAQEFADRVRRYLRAW